jgi:GrpB-like predicted nucleotidyltransferase (UPF0157 family)
MRSEAGEKPLEEMTNEELWALFPIVLREHNPAWAGWYSEEAARLERIIGGDIRRMSHIGSTAVPGLTAKPTVDILLEVREAADTEKMAVRMREAGYIFLEKPESPPPHMLFMKGYTPDGFAEKVFHIHVRYPGDWDEGYFRDYLRAHPAEASAYARLKRELAKAYRHDRDAYTDAKTDFVKRVTRLAREEAENGG